MHAIPHAPFWTAALSSDERSIETCTRHGSTWRRSSAHGIEVGHLDHGTLVRVVVHRDFNEATAKQALQHARPMTGTEHHKLLFQQ